MKQVSFKALQRMAQEFDDNEEDGSWPEGRSAMDFYLYVVDNYETVEKEVAEGN